MESWYEAILSESGSAGWGSEAESDKFKGTKLYKKDTFSKPPKFNDQVWCDGTLHNFTLPQKGGGKRG